MNMSHLNTERLTFRLFRASDSTALVQLLNDLAISRWIGPMPHPYTPADAREYLEQTVRADRPIYALEHQGALSGAIGIGKMLGFWLAKPLWGKGLMTEACRSLISKHFSDGAAELVSGYHLGNQGSWRVHEKLGFQENGTSEVHSLALQRSVTRQDLLLTRERWEALA